MLQLLLALATASPAIDVDPRTAYDVLTYRIDLEVLPATKTIAGTVAMEALVLRDDTDTVVLDLKSGFKVAGVYELVEPLSGTSTLTGGRALRFRYEPPLLMCELGRKEAKDSTVRLAVAYAGAPRALDSFTGFHWKQTADGRPWISTSCQGTGSASWWPSKDSYFHPDDKPERIFENYTVPQGLYAVGNGRLTARTANANDTEAFHWAHAYPLETYSVTLNVAPYVVVETTLEIEAHADPLPFIYYVLPENVEKAALQFQDVEPMLEAFTQAFGTFPFETSKFALVETSFWGMEHSTAVAYGSSYPAWLKVHGGRDPYAGRNKYFDYILVHESAHEWWGNAVSARAWGDFWIHEGFATFAEAVYLEHVQGREIADKHMQSWRSSVGRNSRLYRGDNVDSGAAYDINIYGKGAWVLQTLRTYMQDDARFFAVLRAFNLEYRYKNASTEDFRAVVERETKADWKRFFDEWVYGKGYPKLTGSVRLDGPELVVDVTVAGTSETPFHLPLDLRYDLEDTVVDLRVELAPGRNEQRIRIGACSGLRLASLNRILCDSKVTVE
ncbi:MAG: M1 family metallopeptidase [Planctomycetes bacterium]|nr:M1 family metallopeptidase [Planctomycetota bacterium]